MQIQVKSFSKFSRPILQCDLSDLGIVVGARWAGLRIFMYNRMNCVENIQWLSQKHLGQKRHLGQSGQEGYSKSRKHTLQPWQAEKHLRTHKMVNFDLEDLQHQKTSLGSTLISEEQKS